MCIFVCVRTCVRVYGFIWTPSGTACPFIQVTTVILGTWTSQPAPMSSSTTYYSVTAGKWPNPPPIFPYLKNRDNNGAYSKRAVKMKWVNTSSAQGDAWHIQANRFAILIATEVSGLPEPSSMVQHLGLLLTEPQPKLQLLPKALLSTKTPPLLRTVLFVNVVIQDNRQNGC